MQVLNDATKRTSTEPVTVLVLDAGSTNVKASVLGEDGNLLASVTRALPPLRPGPGLSEFDPVALARAVLEVAEACTAQAGADPDCVGVCAQRASTVLWDAREFAPTGPGLSWQDLRTVGHCLALQARGLTVSPNQSATKLAYLLGQVPEARRDQLRFSTIDSWIVAVLSAGKAHVSDPTNLAVTGLLRLDGTDWDEHALEVLGIAKDLLPTRVDSMGYVADASALAGSPPIMGLVGDQQASLVGQGCIEAGDAKATFGTGAMLDCCLGSTRPSVGRRGPSGTFPIITWSVQQQLHWGLEAILLSAGSCLDWLVSLGVLPDAAASDALAASVSSSAGAYFVPAFGGLGTPDWDFGARGLLVGLDASVGAGEIVRAVLEGVAQSACDLLEAVEHDCGRGIEELHVDGGMSRNATFVQLLADAIGRPVAVSHEREATTLGAGFLAGTAAGLWSNLQEATATAKPPRRVEPRRRLDRERWLDAKSRALSFVPALSQLKF